MASTMRELTLRGIIIGGLITLVFTAANVYLGLKVGLTFATSIPAAVISMAVLRKFAGHNVRENNIVQTIASAAGTLSAIIFVLPGLVMVGYWQGFPFWTTALVCALGGTLGVMYSIPLRRALVTGSDLPYPEGVAAAEVLRVGDGDNGGSERDHAENSEGLRVIILGAVASAFYSLLTAMKAAASEVAGFFRVGGGGTMMGGSLSLALLGVGHLVGLPVGIAMLVGVVISFAVLLPMKSAAHMGDGLELAEVVSTTFADEIRFIGVGTMAVAALWTLIKIAKPIATGIASSLAASKKRHEGVAVDVTERDIPFPIVAGVIVASMLPIGLLLWNFVRGTDIHEHALSLTMISVLFILVIGLIVASVCGYMAGLIGASNSPISSIGIIAVLSCALLIGAFMAGTDANASSLVAYTLFTAAIVFGIATISNDNLQDLKTGQLVGATPWKQQVALIIGVLFGSVVIPPILQVMLTGFGFQGMEGAGPDALAAPQAALMSSVANGIFNSSLDWGLILLGAGIGVALIIIDETLTRTTGKYSLPPLAVGMGMYLPVAVTVIVPIGGLIGYIYNRWAQVQRHPDFARRMGTLVATGMIVGESLFGVLNAALIAGAAGESPLEVFTEQSWTPWFSTALFVVLVWFVYSKTRSKVTSVAEDGSLHSAGESAKTVS
ncbi:MULTISPECIES: OPT family oligopeptide transporter [unclassified Corynebacterium]|uniref:OPT family oligopeptide transporter n=1 Tax=unclassified Corynebacterium TaxID=2624378 RepID=UPI0008FB9AD8|nr:MULTISPECIES: oligopeptide transporter, OPT family [unclassified Corynebacterium]OIR43852.1 oligopeptide transporter, OPT family [Corynebacterium sp. NML120713]